MSNKILVTDSLFIFDEHVKKLEKAGYEVERLDKPRASEEELCNAVKGKVGYILGGVELITDKIIESADELKAIVFTGTDYKFFIPGWKKALQKGIRIACAPGANAFAVAEFAVSVALAMQRNLFELGRTGDKKFQEAISFKGSTLGVIGAGNIGQQIISILHGFEPKSVLYFNRSRKNVSAEYADLETLVTNADVIFVAVPESAAGLLNKDVLARVKENSLIVSISPKSVIDLDALLPLLQNGRLRAAIDWPAPSAEFEKLPLNVWFNTNDHTAYNTNEANKTGSDMAVESILNMLSNRPDKYEIRA